MRNVLLIFGLASTLYAQNTVIINGEFNEAYDAESVSDITIGNNCNVPAFMNLYYNGDMQLKGDMYISNSTLTIYGDLVHNGFNVFLICENAELLTEPTLTIIEPKAESYVVYPNPTKGLFYVQTRKEFEVDVYDMQGKHLTNFPDLRGFPVGTYLAVITVDNISVTKKIIKI